MTIHALIIDDEQSVQNILSSFLKQYAGTKSWPIEIHNLRNPIEGLFELTTAGERYQIILLDVRLPKMGGDEIYHAIEQVHPAILNRILFVTGYPEDLLARFPEHSLKILQKPFRYHHLATALDDIMASQKAMDCEAQT